MDQTLLQKIRAEKAKVRGGMLQSPDFAGWAEVKSREWWVTYDAGNNDMQYSFQDGPVTLSALMEIVKELKVKGIKEAYYETRYDYFPSGYDRLTRHADIGYDYEAGEHVTVDLAPLFNS